MMDLHTARNLALDFVERYAPYCEKIRIAGSVRRQKPEVKDVEIVALPAWQNDLFGNPLYGYNPLIAKIHQDGHQVIKGQEDGKYTQIVFQGATFDVFCTTHQNWAWNFLIRTGSRDFSHGIARKLNDKGYTLKNAWPHVVIGHDDDLKAIAGEALPGVMETEEEVFRFLGLQYVPPENRTGFEAIKALEAGAYV